MADWEAETKWGYSSCIDPEVWTGSFATREEAIEEARGEFDGEEFYIRSGRAPDPAECMPTPFVENLLDHVAESACEWGDIADEYPDHPPKEAQAELVEFTKAWLRKHCMPTFWIAYGKVERVPGVGPSESKSDGA